MNKNIRRITDSLIKRMPQSRAAPLDVPWDKRHPIGPVTNGMLSQVPQAGQLCVCLQCRQEFEATDDTVFKFDLQTPITVSICVNCGKG